MNKQLAALRVAVLLLVGSVGILLGPVLFGWPPANAEESERKAQQEATAETGGADILATDISVDVDGVLRSSICLDTAGVFSIVIKNKNGTVLDTAQFDKGASILADTGRTFDWPARADRKYNYQTSVTGAVTLYADLVGQ